MSLRRHTLSAEGADFDPDIDPAGNRIVFASTRHCLEPDLYVKSVDGMAITQLTADPASDVQPACSPDGQRIAFASDRAGSWDIWVIDIAGGQPVQITSGAAHDVCPSWSPDGQSIVFSSQPANGGQWEMWIVDTAVGGSRRFIGYGLFPEWSPVADTIVFQRARERGSRWFSIWTLELVDGEPRYPTEVASCPEQALIMPSWSSDGLQIAYCTVRPAAELPDGTISAPEVSDIWVVGADGSGRVRLTNGQNAYFAPTWSRDGRLYFTSQRDGCENVWSLAPPTWASGGFSRQTAMSRGESSQGDSVGHGTRRRP
jgi:TolB protein